METALKCPKTIVKTNYTIKGKIGNKYILNNITADFSLTIDTISNIVSGIFIIKKPNEKSLKLNVVGNLEDNENNFLSKKIILNGEYSIPATPPITGTYKEYFSAYIDYNDDGKGLGGFTSGNTSINSAPVSIKNLF